MGRSSGAGGCKPGRPVTGEPSTVPSSIPTLPPESTGVDPLHAADITSGGCGSDGGVKSGLDPKSNAAAMLFANRSRGGQRRKPVAVADHLEDRLEAVDRVADVAAARVRRDHDGRDPESHLAKIAC